MTCQTSREKRSESVRFVLAENIFVSRYRSWKIHFRKSAWKSLSRSNSELNGGKFPIGAALAVKPTTRVFLNFKGGKRLS